MLDRVVSFYTPTLTALARARRPAPDAPVRQLAVGMSRTPGLPPLPAVSAELDVLATHFPPDVGHHQLAGPLATRADVLTAIAARSWVHLSCHASQQHADPTSSGFALWDGTLTVADLAAQPARHGDLAFLSACQTAAGSVLQTDEAIHLASAMQFFGYRHVIATMWTIADSPAPRVADAFYTALRPDATRSAKPSTMPSASSASTIPPTRRCGHPTYTSAAESHPSLPAKESKRLPAAVTTVAGYAQFCVAEISGGG
jgi:CHAT domain-containing protein